MRRLGLVMATTAALVALAAPALAVPPGQERQGGDTFLCDGSVVVIFGGNGRSAWVGDTLYHAADFSFVGTFTPTGGAPIPVSDEKVWGQGPPGDEITCTANVNESDEEGTLVGVVTIHAVPNPNS
jgi:hypothetical protein